jgi:hypothetical protein
VGEVPLPAGTLTARHVEETALRADWLPVRVSPGSLPPPLLSSRTQRSRPARTSEAIQDIVTELSRPENPPMPATLAPLETIAAAAELWLETASVPPPCDAT